MSPARKKPAEGFRGEALDRHRERIGVRHRQLARSLQALRRLLGNDWNGVADLRRRLILASRALEYFTVDEAMATSYLKARLASQDPRVDSDLRQELKKLHREAFREIQGYVRFELPRGAKPRLTRAREQQACAAYFTLLGFFQDPKNRPSAEAPEDPRLLAEINRLLESFVPKRAILLADLDSLSEEIDPSRTAKLAVALAFEIKYGTVDSIITRRYPPTNQ